MNDDKSFSLLFDNFQLADQRSLWVVDENPSINPPQAHSNIEVISNRLDVVMQLRALGYCTHYNDFDFSELAQNTYQHIFYRISKEKMLTHHIINSAHSLLTDDGHLIISGAKQQGIKGYLERASQLYTKHQVYKADKQHWAASFRQVAHIEDFLDDQNYSQLRDIAIKDSGETLRFYSKPGVFGWHKVDQGSKLLIDQLAAIYNDNHLNAPGSVLDLGCGYGYLGLHCATLFDCKITACDNNAAAIKACAFNLEAYQIQNKVIATDCADGIDEKFDLVVCNPPFHSGFSVTNDLTERFIKGAARCLTKNGTAIFVVNLHIPLERKAKPYFKQVKTISCDSHFKIVILSDNN